MSSEDLFTRDEVLGGMPAQRARTLLFLIENRTGQQVAQSRRAMERFLTDEAAGEQDLAFLEAFSSGKNPPVRPAIQDLERYAGVWADLVPENPRLQAAVAHLLGDKYTFAYSDVPGIRRVLGLDSQVVQQAYQRQYQQPLASLYTTRPGLFDRLSWAWAGLSGWLESLPPFWTAFALTLTETIGMGILALPIALAGLGPLPGVLLLIVMGLVNLVTIAFMAEAVSRSGDIRYGKAYFGRLVANLLGKDGSIILSIALLLFNLLVLLAYYVGFSTTLESATRLPAAVWVGLLFLVNLYFLRSRTLNATVSAALLVGAFNLTIILALSLLAFTKLDPANLAYANVPLLGGRPFEPAILQLVFGVVLSAYFGHTSMGNCAKVVLRRDPGARSLFWGSLAAQAIAILVYSIWLLAVNGAIAPERLAGISSTALVPLAEVAGPVVYVLGSVFVLLGMGMGSIHFSLGLYNQVQEWLPKKSHPVIVLPRRRGSLILHAAGAPDRTVHLGLVYLGLDGEQPRFRLDIQDGKKIRRVEIASQGHLEGSHLLESLPLLKANDLRLSIDVLEAQEASARLQIHTNLAIRFSGEWDATGLGVASLLELPPLHRRAMDALMRAGELSLEELASRVGKSGRELIPALKALVGQGFVRELESPNGTRYRAQLGAKKGRALTKEIWQSLEESPTEPGKNAQSTGRWWRGLREALLGERALFLLSVSPVAGIFLLTQWLLFTGSASFSHPLGFLGVVTVSLMGGIFPALLFVASRRKGEYIPQTVYRALGHPLLTVGIYTVSLGSIVLHGLVIWENPLERSIALVVAGVVLGLTLSMLRRGVFQDRVVLEVRQDLSSGGKTVFTVVAGGQPAETGAQLDYGDGWQELQAARGEMEPFSRLRSAAFLLPARQARDLKVWAHKVSPQGDSQELQARLEAQCGGQVIQQDLKLAQGQVIVPLPDGRTDSCSSIRLLFGEGDL